MGSPNGCSGALSSSWALYDLIPPHRFPIFHAFIHFHAFNARLCQQELLLTLFGYFQRESLGGFGFVWVEIRHFSIRW
jgi:hypothetical protein